MWAAVTSCLTNVPPTLLRAVAAAAAGAAAAPAGLLGEALGSVGRSPSNSRPGVSPATRRSRAPRGAGAGPPLPRPSPASPPSHPRRVHPRARQLPGLWAAGRLSRALGPKGPGYGALARQGRAPAAPRTSPPELAGSGNASPCACGCRRALLGRSQSRLPLLLAPRVSSLASQDAAALSLPAAPLTSLQKCN